jgi:sugar lactone lactonase YvrE
MMAETFSTDKAYIYLVDNLANTITRYTDTGETKTFPSEAGLIGLGVRQRELMCIADA